MLDMQNVYKVDDQMMKEMGPSKQGRSLSGKHKTGCHICGETRATLYKDGEENGQQLYICKDCKDLKPLMEDDEK